MGETALSRAPFWRKRPPGAEVRQLLCVELRPPDPTNARRPAPTWSNHPGGGPSLFRPVHLLASMMAWGGSLSRVSAF